MPELPPTATDWEVAIRIGGDAFLGTLALPAGARGLVLFAHGCGSSRFSPRDQRLARALHRVDLATLRIDLVTEAEEDRAYRSGRLTPDIALAARRLLRAATWARDQAPLARLPLGLFGSDSGAAAALLAAATAPGVVRALACRQSRLDLVGDALAAVSAPAVLLVEATDTALLALHGDVVARLRAPLRVETLDGEHAEEAARQLERRVPAWLLTHLPGAEERPLVAERRPARAASPRSEPARSVGTPLHGR